MAEPIYHIIEDFYNPEELKLIWRELEYLNPKLHYPENTATAINRNTGEYLKNGTGIHVYNYIDYYFSDIGKANRKIFDHDVIDKFIDINPLFRGIAMSNHDTILVNYYKNKGYYKSHTDHSLFTALSFHYKEPKKFSGGDLILTDFDLKIKIKNNMLLIFPGVYKHEATEIIMDDKDLNQGFGRYSIATFINIVPKNFLKEE
jgi:hypothetical protein